MFKINEIEDVNDYYFITKDGRVFSECTNRFLKPQPMTSGYHKVSLRTPEGKTKQLSIHRLVAKAYLPNEKEQVNHLDGNKHNNNVSNLEWCTQSENMIHADRTGLMNYNNKGTANGASKLTEDLVSGMRLLGFKFKEYSERGLNHFNITKACYNQLMRRHTWRHTV